MRNAKEIGLDFLVDKLTNSIENVLTGDSFATDFSVLTQQDLKTLSPKKGWQFDWKSEFINPLRVPTS